MRLRSSVIGTTLILVAIAAAAQTAIDPSGHWEGTVSAASYGDLPLEIDLTKNANGALTGTITLPARKLKGFPLSAIVVEGRTVRFDVAGSTDARFEGDLAADGKSLSGTLNGQAGPFPVALVRKGDARIEPPPTGAKIGKELEGTWTGTLEADGRTLRAVLKMTNNADGTSTGHIISVDEGGLDLPVALVQNGANLVIDVPMVGSSYSGALNAAGTELIGTYKTGQGVELPLTFKRTPPS